jgi:hypothetical protein
MNKTVRFALLALLILVAGFDLGLLLGPRHFTKPSAPVSRLTTLPGGLLATVPDVRQSTNYSCGAAALQAVLSYYGIDKRERALMDMLKTSESTGTSPDNIVRVARELGLQAEVREKLEYGDIVRSGRNSSTATSRRPSGPGSPSSAPSKPGPTRPPASASGRRIGRTGITSSSSGPTPSSYTSRTPRSSGRGASSRSRSSWTGGTITRARPPSTRRTVPTSGRASSSRERSRPARSPTPRSIEAG